MMKLALILGAVALATAVNTSDSRYTRWVSTCAEKGKRTYCYGSGKYRRCYTRQYCVRGGLYQCAMASLGWRRNSYRSAYARRFSTSQRRALDNYEKSINSISMSSSVHLSKGRTAAQAQYLAFYNKAKPYLAAISARKSILPKYTAALTARNTAVANLKKMKDSMDAQMKKIDEYNKSRYFARVKTYWDSKINHANKVLAYYVTLYNTRMKQLKAEEAKATKSIASFAQAEATVEEMSTKKIFVPTNYLFAGANGSPDKYCNYREPSNLYHSWECKTLVKIPAMARMVHKYTFLSSHYLKYAKAGKPYYFTAVGQAFLWNNKNKMQIAGRAISMRNKNWNWNWMNQMNKKAGVSAKRNAECDEVSCFRGVFSNAKNLAKWEKLFSSNSYNRYSYKKVDHELFDHMSAVMKVTANMAFWVRYTTYYSMAASYSWYGRCNDRTRIVPFMRTYTSFSSSKRALRCTTLTASMTNYNYIITAVKKYGKSLEQFFAYNKAVERINEQNNMFLWVRMITMSFYNQFSTVCTATSKSYQYRYCGGSRAYSYYDHVHNGIMWMSSTSSSYASMSTMTEMGRWASYTAGRLNQVQTIFGGPYKLESQQQDFENGNMGLTAHNNKEDNDSVYNRYGWNSRDQTDGVDGTKHVETGEKTFDDFDSKFPQLFNTEGEDELEKKA